MDKNLLFILLVISSFFGYSQTKVSGHVYDANKEPVAFANVLFKDSTEGTITNENGRFYLESEEEWNTLSVSFIGYETVNLELTNKVNYELEIIINELAESLDEVVIISGKQPKKNNPAIDILRKIWENKRKNGLYQFNQYQYDKYEKVEFDLNTIDSSLIKSKLFRGMEFIFNEVDTSRVTGKTYLPMFLNEAVSKVYGDNILNKEKEFNKKGYAYINRRWHDGDAIDLVLEMPIEKIQSHPYVRHNARKIALKRGPVVYCIEEEDNGKHLSSLAVRPYSEFKAVYDPDLLGGCTYLAGPAYRLSAEEFGDVLYRPYSPDYVKTEIKAIPYAMWTNRTPGDMTVWINLI